MKRLYIAGCGYAGERLARAALSEGWQVTAQARNMKRAEALGNQGIATEVFGADDLDEIPSLKSVNGAVLLYSIPPQGGGTIDLRLRAVLQALDRDRSVPSRLVYLSATSVYGDTGGQLVTESDSTNPTSAMGKRRVDAEQLIRAYAERHGIQYVILRVSAIYGKGRLPLMQITQGQPLLKEELAKPSNRIHIDDLVAVCKAALTQGEGVYNVSDGAPCSMTEYFNSCADALGKPRQPQVDIEEARASMPPLLFTYFMESRIVDNTRMRHELLPSLAYASCREGIAASV